MKPVSFSELAEYTNKQLIPCVQGTLKYINDPKKYKSGPNEGKEFQYGTIREIGSGLEIGVKFEADLVQPTSNKGKTIQLQAHEGKKGLSGVYMEIGEYDGKETRTARCTATAIVTYIASGDAAANSGASQPSGGSGQRSTPSDAPTGSKTQGNGHQAGPVKPVSGRIADTLLIAEEVCKLAGRSYEKFLAEELDVQKLAVGIYISYKEGYVHHDPVFGSGPAPQTANAKQAEVDKSWEDEKEEKPKANLPSWKDFVHPKTGKKLGEMEDEKFLRFAAWALTYSGDDREAKAFQSNVLLGVHDKKLTHKIIFLDHLSAKPGFGDGFDLDDLEQALFQEYGKDSKKVTEEQWLDALKRVSEIVEACKEAHANRGEEGGIPD